ncbi:hypothetical protein MBANPS3_006768 [Mucor bainieri]
MEAYVTLVATDSYAAGALVLAHRLRDLGSSKEIVCLVTPNISSQVQDILSNICTLVQVDTLRSSDYKNLQLLGRPELDITFTKIQLWKLTQYKKIVFLDADTFPIQNIDQLFERPSFSAAPDAGWPDCFNSGVFVTEPSDAVYSGLCQLASDKGSFDGGDQGLLNSFFSTWPTSPEHRLPFTFNTTPTSQYGYAPAQNEYGQNISIVHFIGENKPWKYQRFADGRVLPLGSTWEGTKHMIQAWWNTWDTYYGQTSPYHLLSGEFENKFDDGFQTRPIVPFDESVKNAWDNQPVDLDDHRRQIQPMPPISSITIGQPDWLVQEAERRRQLEEQENARCREEEENRRKAQEQRRQEEEEENRRREEEERSREEQEKRNHEHHHNEEGHYHGHLHDNYQGTDHSDAQQHHHNDQHHHHHHEEHRHEEHQHHHHHEHQAPKEYSMIEWDPAHQEPPNTGSLGADIPDLSSFRNVWDQPRYEQASRWVAPVHQPEPQIMTKPEYAHYNAHDYAPDAYYAPIHHEFSPPPAPAEPEPEPVFHHHHHYHYEEPQHPPSFPWDNKPDHFPPPTRVWQDEQPPPQPEKPVHHQDHDNHVHEEHHHQEQHHHEEHHEAPPQPQHEQHNLSIVIDHHDEQQVEQTAQQSFETHHHAQEEEKTPSPVIEQPQQQDEEPWEEDQQPAFAIDAIMSPSAQNKIDEFIASLNEDEDEEVSDRDLIPIKFKPTSRLSGMYTPSPSGSRVNSRPGSRSNSRSGSRRASVSNSRRNSVVVINKTSLPTTQSQPQPQQPLADNIIAAPTFTIPDDDSTFAQQSQKLFAASSSMFSRKTPYTSAAVTPAIGLTPDEFGADGYFDDADEEEKQVQEDYTFKPDFLNEAQYSLNESLVESTAAEEWDPLNALNKLKEHSESMVLRQSLQEALVKTAKEQQEKEEAELAAAAEPAFMATATSNDALTSSEFLPINKTPSSKKKKYAFRSTWDDEEYDLPSALVSGESSPRTPIARSMSSSDLTKEIEMEKERYKQQRASLMLAQPQAAVASMLEAELDLSRGTLFKRRYYNASNDHQVNVIQSSERITQETSELIESESDEEEDATEFVAYYDDYVIQEAQKRLRALVTGEEVDTATEMPEPIGGPRYNNNDNTASKRPSHMYQYGEAKEPQPLSLLWNSRSYASNFGFDTKHKLPIYRPDLLPTEDVAEEIMSLSTDIIVKEDPYTKKHRLAKETEEQRLKVEQEKLEEEKLQKGRLKKEEPAKISIDDTKLTLDEVKIESTLCKSNEPAKNGIKSKDSSSAITTTIVTTPTKGPDESVESNKSKTSDSTLATSALEIAGASTGIISPESPIPIQTINEKKPTAAHQSSSSSSTSSINSSTTTPRRSQIKWNTTGEDLVKLYKTDLTGKVAIVTGANSGIGLETARVLASVGAKVIIPCRTFEKAEGAIETIKKSVPNADLVPMKLDLSDLSSISEFSSSFYRLDLPLHLLVNNAGVMGLPKSFTENGFETQFGVNHLGHFYLTESLLGKLKANASAGARVVCVSSTGSYHFVGKEGLDFDNLKAEKSYSPAGAYGQSKLANILFAKELQRRFDAEGADIIVTSVHPGTVVTNLGRQFDLYAVWDSFRQARSVFSLAKEAGNYKNIKAGASTSIYCCVSPDAKKGEFYANNEIHRTELNEQADNKEMAKQLWDLSEKLVGKALNPSMN